MVRFSLVSFLLASSIFSYAQQFEELHVKKKFTKEIPYDPVVLFSGTISPGKMIANGLSTVHLNGYLELNDKSIFSYRGDIYQLISYKNNPKSSINPIFQNRLLSGLFSHFQKKNLDVYVGFQGGMSFCYFQNDPLISNYRWSFAPTLSLKSGVRLFIWKYANFYLESTYFHNYINNASFGPTNMNEVVFSGGLGFQIERQKPQKTNTIPGTPSF